MEAKVDLITAGAVLASILILDIVKTLVHNWVNKTFNTEKSISQFCREYDTDLASIKTTLDLRFKEIDRKFTELCDRLSDLEDRLERIEQKFLNFVLGIKQSQEDK